MGHLTSKDAYKTLDQRLNLFPQGAPPSESLFQILRAILRLPPLKQALASKQFKSVYLDKLLSMQYKKK